MLSVSYGGMDALLVTVPCFYHNTSQTVSKY